MPIKLIIGLRNPGSAYEHTRHNAGSWFVSELASHYHASFKKEPNLQADIAIIDIENLICRAILPHTYMNHSGRPARLISQFYKIQADEILVVHDELDLPAGTIKLKTGGGHGGHNGLRDVIAQLGSNQFHRLRIGIGHPGVKELVHDHVLGKANSADRKAIDDAITRCITAMPLVLAGSLSLAMNIINS